MSTFSFDPNKIKVDLERNLYVLQCTNCSFIFNVPLQLTDEMKKEKESRDEEAQEKFIDQIPEN